MGEWTKVLLVQTSFLGDTVLTLPLVSEIKRRYPATNLSVLCSPRACDLLAGYPGIDRVMVDDKNGTDGGLAGLWRKAAELRKEGFTMALCPHKSLRSALLLALARIPRRIGFRQSRGWFLFHTRVDRDFSRHDVERNLSILQAFGIAPRDCRRSLDLPLDRHAASGADRLLRSLGVDPTKPLIGINPGSVWPTKRWAPESFARLIQLLRKQHDCEVVLFGGPEDIETVAHVRRGAPDAVSLAGKTSLRDLPAALSRCAVLVCNDTGPMHIAVALGIPVVAIFCSTTPSLGFYPYSSRAIVVEKKLACRPCGLHGGRRCPLGTEDCIRLIEPEVVARAVGRLLHPEAYPAAKAADPYTPQWVSV
ncbi:MAG TPA: lipopolysaccharide heptosyltransferase II [Candidatus Eisenbacteria bacterium]|nr:lipopolysaccharide heptosyltransferase II [Candidatus Eisenbacteria bacterium]